MSLFRQEALDSKRRKLFGEVILIQPLGFYFMTATFFALTFVSVWFLGTKDYVRKETVAGYVTPSSGLTVIRADRGGQLVQLFVSEGDVVDVGTPLFESRVDVETSEGFVSERQLESTDVRLSELQQQETATETRYRSDERRLRDRLANLRRELAGLNRRLALQEQAVFVSEERMAKMERLLAQEVASQIEFDQARSDNIDQSLALETIRQQIVSNESTITETRHALGALGPDMERELAQLRQQIAQLEESRTSLQAASSYIVRSPIAGTVTALQGVVGATLRPTNPIAVIVPEDAEMIATILAPTRSAGFLAPGQDVNLLIDAFPYQKFGVQAGVITEISDTPFRPGEFDAPIPFAEPVYRIKVSLEKSTVTAYGREVPLKPGMTLQGDLITDRRTLVEWMFDPLFSLRRS